MKKIKNMSIGDLAAFICTHLKNNDIECVLTGGACVSIYTVNKYLSKDLDFIDITYAQRNKLKSAMLTIGFTEHNRYFVNPDTEFLIEFPPGPLTVGKENITDVNIIEFDTGTLRLLKPADSIKDRLAAYFYWDDMQSLEQAELIFKEYDIDMNEIKKWISNEGQTEKFKAINQKFKKL